MLRFVYSSAASSTVKIFKYVYHARHRIRKYTFCARCTGQGNYSELIPTVQMESQHSTGVLTCHDFSPFVFISEKSRPEVGSRWRCSRTLWPFWKKDPLLAYFHKCFAKGFMRMRKHVLCANFVKFGRPKVGEIARCSRDKKKTKLRNALQLSLLRGSRPKSVRDSSRQYSRSAPNFIQTVYFRWSYSQMRERRWNAPQSVSNTPRKPRLW